MAIDSTVPRLNPGGSCALTGARAPVIQSVGATRTLSPEESGSMCLFDRAAGVVYTLPTPSEGMEFEFGVTVAVTSNAYKVITGAATQFLIGSVLSGNLTVAASGDVFQANGTTHVAISMNGTDTGGLVGGKLRFRAISATQWYVEGINVGSGTNADPFATS
jgi:hypothetical protein